MIDQLSFDFRPRLFAVSWWSSKPCPHGGTYAWLWSDCTEADVRSLVPRALDRWPDATATVEVVQR